MANYISSNQNRFYAALESAFGQVPAITGANRLLGVELQAHQQLQPAMRRDKTGTRSFLGYSPLSRRGTAFSFSTYLSSWDSVDTPAYGPLIQSVCGGQTSYTAQIAVSNMPDMLHVVTAAPHGLSTGSAISQGSQIRFVSSVIDELTVQINAPFASALLAGALLTPALTYTLGNLLPSFSLFDYWDPATAVQRIITGATADTLSIALNGGFHEMSFSGLAADLGDSQSFSAGWAGLETFPTEPAIGSFEPSVVTGNLGEAWVGVTAVQVFSLTQAAVLIKNNLVPRNMEFGAIYPRSIAPGPREVSIGFSLFVDDSTLANSLYISAKQRTPTSVMLQLGQEQGQMMGIYLPNVVLELPYYDDKEPRLIWDFKANTATGTNNDELTIALA